MKRKSVLSILFVLIFCSVDLFSQINFISPVEGVWSNKQMLVIDNAGEGDYLYSIDGSDPEKFGFAYDGPVLLDVTGDVKINVAHLKSDGKKETASINYSVKNDNAEKTVYESFVKTFFESGIINYSAGSEFSIPQNLLFSFGLPPDSFAEGTVLIINSSCVYSRCIPCVVYDKEKDVKYRFIVRIIPQNAGTTTVRDVPFSITDWNTINFNDDNLIYKLDTEYWELPKKPKKINRSVSHMISWQPLVYDKDNPIEFFVLPPKPEIKKDTLIDGSIIYSLEGDESYKLSIYSTEKKAYTDFFDTIGIDVFDGDRINEKIIVGVFANSVFQGEFTEQVEINKRAPVIPQIKTTAKAFYSREKVDLEISAEKNSELYIALSDPVTLGVNKVPYSSDSVYLKNIPVGNFKKNKKNNFKISWSQKGVGPVYYKVQAYSKNSVNKSQIVEYSVIIDQSNYYYDSSANKDLAEGTAEHPFTDFEQCVNSLVKNRTTNLNVKGELLIDKKYDIESNLKFINEENGSIVFGPQGSIHVKGSTVDLNHFDIKNIEDADVTNIVPFFSLTNAILNIDDCLFAANFSKNGTIIDSYNSIINVKNTIAAVVSVTYASFVSSVKTRLNIEKTSVTVSSDTAVVFSLKDGNFQAKESDFSIYGKAGRIAELFGVKANFTKNTLKADFSTENTQNVPLYFDKNTSLTDKENEKIGF